MPGRKQACPISAACWSPAIAAIGIASPNISGRVAPKSPPVACTSGNSRRGMPSASLNSASQARRCRSNSIVREAFVTSVACNLPPVRRHKRKLSIVPNAISPLAARSRSPGTLSSIQRIFDAEKYGSTTSPVRCATAFPKPAARHSSQSGAVRRSCQTIALCTARPLARSHNTAVSRWFVIPMAAMGPFAAAIASRQVATTPAQISSGSCSTQPGCG